MLAYCVLCRGLRLPVCIAILSVFVWVWMPAARAQSFNHEGIVVLDPGHGGLDTGAKGPGGTLEKTVALNLCRMVAAALASEHRVILTRTGDYGLDLPSRSAIANQAKADLFISIHAGGGFLHQASGMYVFYFKELPTVSESEKMPAASGGIENWDFLQYRHIERSSELAQEMETRLRDGKAFKVNGVETGPLLVLRGADMPAVLVEVGYLTHPLEEKRLQDPQVLADIADRIRDAVSAFLAKDIR